MAGILLFFAVALLFLFLWYSNQLKIKLFGFEKEENTTSKAGQNFSPDEKQKHLLIVFLCFNLFLYSLIALLVFSIFQLCFSQSSFLLKAVIFSALTALAVFFGESLPSFRPSSGPISKREKLFIKTIKKIFGPIVPPLLWLDKLLDKYVIKREQQLVLEEINEILEEPENIDEKEILKGIFNFSHISVKQIMKPRLEFTAFSKGLSFHELLNKINKFAYSRVPVFSDTLDKIEGLLYIKDLLPHINRDENFRWQRLIRPAYFVPENKKIEELLRDFQQGRVHMAIVVDEYGGTAGLVTLEDIIEQIIGDLQDEFDEEETTWRKVSENVFIFEGKSLILDFCKVLNVEIDEFNKVRQDTESVAGLVLEIFGRFPKIGERATHSNFVFTVLSADNKRIRKVQVEKLLEENTTGK